MPEEEAEADQERERAVGHERQVAQPREHQADDERARSRAPAYGDDPGDEQRHQERLADPLEHAAAHGGTDEVHRSHAR